MRISDWISDVCSSYLFQDPPLGLRPAGLHRVLGRLVDANPHVNPPLPVHAARVGTARRRFGRGGRIRTAGPLLPKQMRYQTALHPETLQSRGIPSLSRRGDQVRSYDTRFSREPALRTAIGRAPV